MLHLFTKIEMWSIQSCKDSLGLETSCFCSNPLEKRVYYALTVTLPSGILTNVVCHVNVVTSGISLSSFRISVYIHLQHYIFILPCDIWS